MSTGLNCAYVEAKPGEWYYILQDWDCPVGAWDWREYATAYGPFATEDQMRDHLDSNHANPGGASIDRYTEGWQPDEVEQKLFAEARNRPAETRRNSLYRW